MREVMFGTKNQVKLATAQYVFAGLDITVIPPEVSPKKRVVTLEQRVKAKVVDDFEDNTYRACIAEDMALEIQGLGGGPGIHLKSRLEQEGIEGILNALRGNGKRDRNRRKCELKLGVAYVDAGLSRYDQRTQRPVFKPHYEETVIEGRIAAEPQGRLRDKQWSQVYLIFIPEGEEKTIAEMTGSEYSRWDKTFSAHLEKMARWVDERHPDLNLPRHQEMVKKRQEEYARQYGKNGTSRPHA